MWCRGRSSTATFCAAVVFLCRRPAIYRPADMGTKLLWYTCVERRRSSRWYSSHQRGAPTGCETVDTWNAKRSSADRRAETNQLARQCGEFDFVTLQLSFDLCRAA